jgi:hypothetical protein
MLGISLVLCAGLLTWLNDWRGKLIAVLVFVLLWIPVGAANMPVVAYIRGITSDLSITLITLAVWRMGHLVLGWRATAKPERMVVMAVVAVAALFLYPLALGWSDWDAYRPGWGSWGMLLALLVLCVVCWVKGFQVVPALVALALLAWSFGLMESPNLWDYLLDPWLSIYALSFVFIKCAQTIFKRFR